MLAYTAGVILLARSKWLNRGSRRKLYEAINARDLTMDPPKANLSWEKAEGYRDGWSVLIVIGGLGVPVRRFGPFSLVYPESVAEQIINMVSDNERLFVLA